MADYTEMDKKTIRTAAFGAVSMVSQADPGFFASVKESVAGSRALANSPALAALLKGTGFGDIPKGKPAELEPQVLTALKDSAALIQEKSPSDVDGFKTAIIQACEQVANSSKGVSDAETGALTKIKAALGA